jgi:hypothetical protein
MGMGNAVPYPYPFYPLGKVFFSLIYLSIKKITHILALIRIHRVSGRNSIFSPGSAGAPAAAAIAAI